MRKIDWDSPIEPYREPLWLGLLKSPSMLFSVATSIAIAGIICYATWPKF